MSNLRASNLRASGLRASGIRASGARASGIRASGARANGLRASGARASGDRRLPASPPRPRPRAAAALALALALAGAALLAPARPARAADEPALTPETAARVTELTKEAQELRRAGDFAAAAEKLEEAIALYPAPVLFYNLGRIREDQGDLAAAATAYERCLAGSPPKDVRPLAQKALKDVRARLAQGTLILDGVPADAVVVVDGVRRGSGPPGPLRLAPGTHRIEVRREGHEPFAKTVELTGGGSATVRVHLEPLAERGPDGTGPDGTGPDGTGPDGTGPDGTGPDGTGPAGDAGTVAAGAHADRHRLFRLGLTVSAGALVFDGEAFRGKVGLELMPSLDFRWLKVDVAAAVVVEPPVAFLLRPGVRFGLGVFYVRPALQFLLTPVTTSGALFGVGAEVPLGAGWSLLAELDVSVWFAAVNVVPLDGRVGVSYGF